MTDTYAKNTAISAKDAEKLTPRAEFRVFGQGIIEPLKTKMWDAKATLYKVRVMPKETYILSKKTDEANVRMTLSRARHKLKQIIEQSTEYGKTY